MTNGLFRWWNNGFQDIERNIGLFIIGFHCDNLFFASLISQRCWSAKSATSFADYGFEARRSMLMDVAQIDGSLEIIDEERFFCDRIVGFEERGVSWSFVM